MAMAISLATARPVTMGSVLSGLHLSTIYMVVVGKQFTCDSCCGLVGNSHLTAKIYFFAPLPTSTKYIYIYILGPPVVPFSPLFWGRGPLLNRLQKKGYPYSILCTGGLSICIYINMWFNKYTRYYLTVDGRNPFRATLKPGLLVCTEESSFQGFLGGAGFDVRSRHT